MSLRLSSLDYLGLVASRLRRDAVQSKLKLETIDTIINSVKVSMVVPREGKPRRFFFHLENLTVFSHQILGSVFAVGSSILGTM